MRTTVRLDDRLLADAKHLAAESGRTLTAVIEDSLREVLARKRLAPKRQPRRLPTFKGRGLHPGVDLDNNASLLDLLGDER